MDKLGIHAFVWTGGSSKKEIEGAIEKTHELGYRLIEFPRLDPTKFDVPWLAKRLGELGLKVVVTMGLPFDGDISSEDPAAVKRGEQILGDAVSVTRDLGGSKLGGIIFSAHGKYLTMPTAKGRANSIAVMRRIAEKAKPANVTLNLEVVNRFESNLLNTAAQGLAYIREAAMDNIFLHLDTFHMQIEEADPAQAVLSAGDRLGYFHVGESNRGYLGAGTIDFDPLFDALIANGYDDFITFESFSSAVVDKDLSIVAGIWRNTWKDNVALARHAKAFIEMRYDEAARRALTARTP
jgi:D-psicose/D-tagatose/L-ribulose 3-epimerase